MLGEHAATKSNRDEIDPASVARPLTVVIVTDYFAEGMGYAGNLLPKALAAHGAKVHVVTTPASPYYHSKTADASYTSFKRPERKSGEVHLVDGYHIHYLQDGYKLGKIVIHGLGRKLKELRPDVVQHFSPVSWGPLQTAWHSLTQGYLLYTGNHTTRSVFPLAQRPHAIWERDRLLNFFIRWLPGRVISYKTTRCYGATNDCSVVAEFMGVPKRKIVTVPLGVDADIFHPIRDPRLRTAERARLGVADDEILCVYTGRFTSDKNPLLLAQAVEKLRGEGLPFKALFVGDGAQKDAIQACRGAILGPFVPFQELVRPYWAADIGVWPTQESTSMIDAAACGLPIVVNDTLQATERINGNGLQYRLNDCADLVRVLRGLANKDERLRLGHTGATRMAEEFSWKAIARQRLADYRHDLIARGLA
jgi:glycosyltransferase involved in cell wall biosynthesis